MSIKNVEKFLNLVKSNEKLQKELILINEKLQKEEGNEEKIIADNVVPLAKKNGIIFTAKDFLQYANEQMSALSEEDLLNVSGGISARNTAAALLVTFLGSLGVGAAVNLLNLPQQEDNKSLVRKAEKNNGEDSRNNQDEVNSAAQNAVDKMSTTDQKTDVSEENNNENEAQAGGNIAHNDNEASETNEAEQKNRKDVIQNKNVVLPNSNAKNAPTAPQINVAPLKANTAAKEAPGAVKTAEHAEKVGGYESDVKDSKNKRLTANEANYLVKNLKNRTSLKLNKESSKDKKAYKLLKQFTITEAEVLAQYLNSTIFSFEGKQFNKKIRGGIPAGKSGKIIPFVNESLLLQMAAHENFGHIIYPKAVTTDTKKADTAKPAVKKDDTGKTANKTAEATAKKDETIKSAAKKNEVAKPVAKATNEDTSKKIVTSTEESKESAKILYSGECGEKAKWSFDEDGTFTISGTGPLQEYGYNEEPFPDEIKYSVKRIIIEEGITSLKNFFVFPFVASIDISASLTELNADYFKACHQLESINVNEDNTEFKSIDGVLFSKDGTKLLCYPGGKTDPSYTIPTGVTSIDKGAFFASRFLNNLIISSSVSEIGENAFASSEIKTVVYLGDNEPNFGGHASGVNNSTQIFGPNNFNGETFDGIAVTKVEDINAKSAEFSNTGAVGAAKHVEYVGGRIIDYVSWHVWNRTVTSQAEHLVNFLRSLPRTSNGLPDLRYVSEATRAQLEADIIHVGSQIRTEKDGITLYLSGNNFIEDWDTVSQPNLRMMRDLYNHFTASSTNNVVAEVKPDTELEAFKQIGLKSGNQKYERFDFESGAYFNDELAEHILNNLDNFENIDAEGQRGLMLDTIALFESVEDKADGIYKLGLLFDDSEISKENQQKLWKFYSEKVEPNYENIVKPTNDYEGLLALDNKVLELGDLLKALSPYMHRFESLDPRSKDLLLHYIDDLCYKFYDEDTKKFEVKVTKGDPQEIIGIVGELLKIADNNIFNQGEAEEAKGVGNQKFSIWDKIKGATITTGKAAVGLTLFSVAIIVGEVVIHFPTYRDVWRQATSPDIKGKVNDIEQKKVYDPKQELKESKAPEKKGLFEDVTFWGEGGSIENVKKNAKAMYEGSKLESAVNKVTSTATEVAKKAKSYYENWRNGGPTENANQVDTGIPPANATHLDPLGKTPATNLNIKNMIYDYDLSPENFSTSQQTMPEDYISYVDWAKQRGEEPMSYKDFCYGQKSTPEKIKQRASELKSRIFGKSNRKSNAGQTVNLAGNINQADAIESEGVNITSPITPAPNPAPVPPAFGENNANTSTKTSTNSGLLNTIKNILKRGGAPKSAANKEFRTYSPTTQETLNRANAETITQPGKSTSTAVANVNIPDSQANIEKLAKTSALVDPDGKPAVARSIKKIQPTSTPDVNRRLTDDEIGVTFLRDNGGKAEAPKSPLQVDYTVKGAPKLNDAVQNPHIDLGGNNTEAITQPGTEVAVFNPGSSNAVAPKSTAVALPNTDSYRAMEDSNGSVLKIDSNYYNLAEAEVPQKAAPKGQSNYSIKNNAQRNLITKDSNIPRLDTPFKVNPDRDPGEGVMQSLNTSESSGIMQPSTFNPNAGSGNDGALQINQINDIEITDIKTLKPVEGTDNFNLKIYPNLNANGNNGQNNKGNNDITTPIAVNPNIKPEITPVAESPVNVDGVDIKIEPTKNIEAEVPQNAAPGSMTGYSTSNWSEENYIKLGNRDSEIAKNSNKAEAPKSTLTPKEDANAAKIFNEYTSTGSIQVDAPHDDANAKTPSDLPPMTPEEVKKSLPKPVSKSEEFGTTSNTTPVDAPHHDYVTAKTPSDITPMNPEEVQKILDQTVPTTEKKNTNKGKGLEIPGLDTPFEVTPDRGPGEGAIQLPNAEVKSAIEKTIDTSKLPLKNFKGTTKIDSTNSTGGSARDMNLKVEPNYYNPPRSENFFTKWYNRLFSKWYNRLFSKSEAKNDATSSFVPVENNNVENSNNTTLLNVNVGKKSADKFEEGLMKFGEKLEVPGTNFTKVKKVTNTSRKTAPKPQPGPTPVPRTSNTTLKDEVKKYFSDHPGVTATGAALVTGIVGAAVYGATKSAKSAAQPGDGNNNQNGGQDNGNNNQNENNLLDFGEAGDSENLNAQEIHVFAKGLRKVELDKFIDAMCGEDGKLDEEKEEYKRLCNIRVNCEINDAGVILYGHTLSEENATTFIDYGNKLFSWGYKEGNSIKCAILNESAQDFLSEYGIKKLKACVAELRQKINNGETGKLPEFLKEKIEKFANDAEEIIEDREKKAAAASDGSVDQDGGQDDDNNNQNENSLFDFGESVDSKNLNAEEIHAFAEHLRNNFKLNNFLSLAKQTDKKKLDDFKADFDFTKDGVTWNGYAVEEDDALTLIDYTKKALYSFYEKGNSIKCAIFTENVQEFLDACKRNKGDDGDDNDNIETLEAFVAELQKKNDSGEVAKLPDFLAARVVILLDAANKFIKDKKREAAAAPADEDGGEDAAPAGGAEEAAQPHPAPAPAPEPAAEKKEELAAAGEGGEEKLVQQPESKKRRKNRNKGKNKNKGNVSAAPKEQPDEDLDDDAGSDVAAAQEAPPLTYEEAIGLVNFLKARKNLHLAPNKNRSQLALLERFVRTNLKELRKKNEKKDKKKNETTVFSFNGIPFNEKVEDNVPQKGKTGSQILQEAANANADLINES